VRHSPDSNASRESRNRPDPSQGKKKG
jgi:hypothetical protein